MLVYYRYLLVSTPQIQREERLRDREMETVIIALYADLKMGWGREGMKRIQTTAKCVFSFLLEYSMRSEVSREPVFLDGLLRQKSISGTE